MKKILETIIIIIFCYFPITAQAEIKAIIELSDNSIETFFKISCHFRETLNDTTP